MMNLQYDVHITVIDIVEHIPLSHAQPKSSIMLSVAMLIKIKCKLF